ncbi:MAG: UbiA prenyltransferase family protein [Dokdonella sp.]|uniref:UbiA prenyltransferase family protein n=1 Tax=Dokdonella sp. TaxID=2291710 RepID=UPI002BF358C4|nr:UbiA prenyltransferase family protein [Dokdonella sp.]HOX70637.1 UbiA prenyltransferase family protein [Dokdonella sp.]HOX71905.1 UbiA prenyltransferase family protein [Dokdonella sp.]HPG93299.1 UbiA prenyltransferase family protein [Dokdonella sp.]HPN78884.1 UbiA prenyltransferase family protein [Dokdonella sp.]
MLPMRPIIELARPGQWIKNGFVLLPLFFGHAMFEREALRGALLATLAFCLAASAVYAFNDTRDVERDRVHPDKCRRPLARGALTVRTALGLAVCLALLAMATAASCGIEVVAIIAFYLVMQLGYSLGLKRVAFVDVTIVASGFALRILAGGVAAQVPLTPWILVMGFLLALMLALGKRHGDLVHVGEARAHAATYDQVTIERVLGVLSLTVLVAYVLYTVSPSVLERHGQHALAYSTPWVLLGVLRYLFLVLKRGAGGDPSRLAVRDPYLLLATTGWLTTLAIILYH